MMTSPKPDLRIRTKEFALRIIRLYQALPTTGEGQAPGKQVARSGRAIGAQYREAWRVKSVRDFIGMNEDGLQELDETAYWLEIFADAKFSHRND